MLTSSLRIDVDGDELEKTHFCLVSYMYLELSKITCDTLDTYPSVQMDPTGRIMLHEFTRYSTLGPASERKCCTAQH